MIRRRLVVCGVMIFLFSSCVSQYKVRVDFSSDLRDYFTEYPSIEVDIAAVTDDEAGEVKQMGVEKYFAPGSGVRDRLQSQTCFFNREDQVFFVLPSRAPVWQSWQLKKPTTVLVIASLPHDPDMSPQPDPRYLLVTMKKSVILARTVNILVEPKKVVQVAKAAKLKKADTNRSSPEAYAQWVEPRR